MNCIHPLGSVVPRMYLSHLYLSRRKSAKKIGLAGLVNCGKGKYDVGPCTLCSVYWEREGRGNNIYRGICEISGGGNQSYGRLGEVDGMGMRMGMGKGRNKGYKITSTNRTEI